MEDTSEDEKLTEKEALKRAKAEGIEFVDEYRLATKEGFTMQPEIYQTKKEAETALAKHKDSKDFFVAQTRRQK